MKKYLKIIFMVLLVLLDQITKYLVFSNMNLYSEIKVIPNFFSITYSINYGAAFGIFEGQKIMFYIITVLVLILIIKEFKKYSNNKLSLISLIFITSGIIGNFIDRVFKGYVVDFLDFNIFGYDFPIFNIADSLMVIGAILLIIYFIKEEKCKSVKKIKE